MPVFTCTDLTWIGVGFLTDVCDMYVITSRDQILQAYTALGVVFKEKKIASDILNLIKV